MKRNGQERREMYVKERREMDVKEQREMGGGD